MTALLQSLESAKIWNDLQSDAERMSFILNLFPDDWEPLSVTSLATLAAIVDFIGYNVPSSNEGLAKCLLALERTGAISTRQNPQNKQIEVKINYGSL